MPALGDQIEIRKGPTVVSVGAVTSVARVIGVVDGAAFEKVVAVLWLGGSKVSGELHRDDVGIWYAHERDLRPAAADGTPA